MIQSIVFDLDNTLVDFMAMKHQAIEAAIDAMLDAGLDLERADIKTRIDAIYKERGIEYQQVFDDLIFGVFNKIDHRILAAGVIAYRRAREAALKPYPHATSTLMRCCVVELNLPYSPTLPAAKHGCDFAISDFIISLISLLHSMRPASANLPHALF